MDSEELDVLLLKGHDKDGTGAQGNLGLLPQ